MMKRFRQILRLAAFRQYKKHYLYRLVWFGCISVCIPVLLIGGVYYQFSRSSAINELENVSESSLVLSEERLERILQGIELSSLQLATDPLIRNSFLDGDSKEKILVHLDILKLLQVAKTTNDFIDDILVYNDASEDILNYRQGFVLKKMFTYENVLDQMMQMEQKDRCTGIPQAGQDAFLSCIRFLASPGATQAKGLLVVKLDNKMIQTYLEGPAVYNARQSILVLDASGQALAKVGEYFKDGTVQDDPSVQTIIDSKQNEGRFFVDGDDGNRYFYSYRKSELGRIYISKTSDADIAKHVSWIRWVMVSTILLVINIGILLTIITSLKVYNPIKQLVDLGKKLSVQGAGPQPQSAGDLSFIRQCWIYLNEESQKINRYVQKWEPAVKESFLLQLLERGAADWNLTDVQSGVASLIGEERFFAVLVIEVEDLYKETRFSHRDGPIVSFMIKNVLNELLYKQERLTGEAATDRNGLGIGLVSSRQELSESEMVAELKRFAEELVQAFRHFLKLKICVGMSRLYRHIDDVYTAYREATEALNYRIHSGHSAILYIDELENVKKRESFYYPATIEEALIGYLEARRFSEAEHSLSEYMKAILSSGSHQVVSQCYSLLLASVIKSLAKLGYAQIFEHHLAESFQQRKTPSEVYDWIVHAVFPLYERVPEQSGGDNLLIKKVCQFINEHVHEDLSLSQCAVLAGVSPSHLSKLFKKESGMNFLDYVLDRKLKHAQELLVGTSMSIQEIAGQIGYSERSLIRIFQKYVHMSPNQYRLVKVSTSGS